MLNPIPPRSLKLLAVLAAVAPVAAASADTIHFGDDFESYPIGALPTSGHWNYGSSIEGINFAVVDATEVTPSSTGGSKVLKFERTGSTTTTLIGDLDPDLALEAGKSVRFSFEARRSGTKDGVRVYLSAENTASDFVAQIDTSTSGAKLKYSNGGGSLAEVTSDFSMASDTWYRFDVTVNVTDSSLTYDLSVTPDGGTAQVIATGALPRNMEAGDELGVRVGPRSNNTLMYFDNFEVGVIPEPATVGLIAAGAGLSMSRPRR